MKLIPKTLTRNWFMGLVYFLLVTFLVGVHLRLSPYAYDDAYIHFRVVRNLFETGRPYFNPNDMLKVSTSSGWVVFISILFSMAKIFKAENNLPFIVSIANALISFGGMLVYTKLMELLIDRRLSFPVKLLFQLLFMAMILPSSIGLMETPLALLIAGLGLYFLMNSRPFGFVFLGLAVYIRLELSILLALAFLVVLIQKRLRLHQVISYTVLGCLPFVVFDLYFYHTIIPHSLIAKSIMYSISTFDTLRYLLLTLPLNLNRGNQLYLTITSLVFFFTAFLTGRTIFWKKNLLKDPWPVLFYLWSLGILAVYFSRHVLIFGWYTPLYIIPLLVACFAGSALARYPVNVVLRTPLFALLLLSIVSITRTGYASVTNPAAFTLFESGSRVKMYLYVGKLLYQDYPHASLLTSEIGGLGYSFKGRIIDAGGLASSSALAFLPMKVPEQRASGDLVAIPPGFVRATMPDIIVSFDVFAQALLADDIIDQYNMVMIPAYLPEDAVHSPSQLIWDSEYLRVFVRKTLPLSENILVLGK